MRKALTMVTITTALAFLVACSTAYKAKPLPFKTASSYPNAKDAAGAVIGAQAFVDSNEATEAFGFDVRGTGLLPVQVVFDNQGTHPLEINPSQTFLEDREGNLWPILPSDTAYERATKYAETKKIFKESAYTGFLGGAAGAVIGAAIGIVSGHNVASTAAKGAAVGAAAGATIGGVKEYASNDARREIINDLNQKSMQNKAIDPKGMAFGFLFFPGEATSAKQLRLQVKELDTGKVHLIMLGF